MITFHKMRRHIKHYSFAAVCLGALMLLLGYAASWTDNNAYSISATAIVIIGTAAYVYALKKESKY